MRGNLPARILQGAAVSGSLLADLPPSQDYGRPRKIAAR